MQQQLPGFIYMTEIPSRAVILHRTTCCHIILGLPSLPFPSETAEGKIRREQMKKAKEKAKFSSAWVSEKLSDRVREWVFQGE